MNNPRKRLTLILLVLVVPLLLLLLFTRTVLAHRMDSPVAETDPALRVAIPEDLSYVELENSQILVRYEPFFDLHAQFAIRHFVLKNAGFIDQAGYFLDADEFRGTIKSATLIYDGADRKTVRLEWNSNYYPGQTIIHEVSIYPNRTFLKIDYVSVRYGVNIVDIGLPGGTSSGEHIAYGGDVWIRDYVTQTYTPTVGSYYNRLTEDGVNDPANGGSLSYHGYFIMGVFNPHNNIGFGRVLPVARIPVIKLLLDDTHRQGFDFLPLSTPLSFTGFLYPVKSGPEEIIEMGKLLADGNLGSYSGDTFQSDDFKRCSLGAGVWTFNNPLSDATLTATGSQVQISVPPGIDHDIWGTGPVDFKNNVASIMQPANDTDFEIEVKFDSGLSQRFQMQGILIKQDSNDWLRFEFHSNGSGTLVYMGRITEGVGANIGGPLDVISPNGVAPLYMRVRRYGNLWTQSYSLNGTNWTIYETVYSPITVTQVGVYVGSTADSGGIPPGHTATFDYFFNTSSPIVPEDGNTNTVTVNVVGNGTVTKTPNLSDYACGSSVSLQANPNPGWAFSNWSGDLSGSDNPKNLLITGDHQVTATFIPLGYTLDINIVGNGNVTKNPDKPVYQHGDQVTLTATPEAFWLFSGWSGGASGSTNPLVITITNNTAITATFKAKTRIYLPALLKP
jgi:regulation of enolase protein 1 (concanavalin A-like superfamily)